MFKSKIFWISLWAVILVVVIWWFYNLAKQEGTVFDEKELIKQSTAPFDTSRLNQREKEKLLKLLEAPIPDDQNISNQEKSRLLESVTAPLP